MNTGTCLAIFALLSATAPASAQMRGVPPRTLTDADTDNEVTVRAGGSVLVRLPSNASTGYSWTVMKATNASVTASDMSETAQPEPGSGSMMVGGGGTTTFRIRVGSPGMASVVLGYVPPGANRSPEQVLHYHFKVLPVRFRNQP